METITNPNPVQTEIIRIPIAGPKPCNTLAFIRCNGGGGDVGITVDEVIRYKSKFTSKFKIDGFQQSQYQWYLDNTQISATAFIHFVTLSTDTSFIFAVDSVLPSLDLDGTIGFECDVAQYLDGPGLFESTPEATFSFSISAYIMLYEPRAEMPPPGNFGKRSLVAYETNPFGGYMKSIARTTLSRNLKKKQEKGSMPESYPNKCHS